MGQRFGLWVKCVRIGVIGSRVLENVTIADLPGVSDTNQVKVNACLDHLRNCDALWIVVPCLRAVDSTTVDHLFGKYEERFRGKIAIVCTRTDDGVDKHLAARLEGERRDLRDFKKLSQQSEKLRVTISSINGKMGTIAMIFQYLRQINLSIRNFADRQQDLMKWRVAVDGAQGIHDAYRALDKAKNGRPLQAWQTIAIEGLRFRYEDQEHRLHHLDGIAINLVHGRKIALVGTSGSGKSTLLRLLQGLHDPEAGTVLIDGAPASFASIAALSTLVPQEPEIFENTLRYNITCGVADETDLDPVIRMACLDSVLQPMPLGLETDIREKGVNLSGGQKQRLALARGLFASREASLLLLDEPTSSLDPSTEALVFDRILAAKIDTCLVASIHRLHLLERFDYVYVLEAGSIVEEGSLADLLARNGRLKQMWDAQKSREETDPA